MCKFPKENISLAYYIFYSFIKINILGKLYNLKFLVIKKTNECEDNSFQRIQSMKPSQKENLHRLATGISDVFVPPLMAAIAFLLLCLHYANNFGQFALWIITCFIFASMLPMAYVIYLKINGQVSHPLIPIKEQRNKPYLYGMMCYTIGFILLIFLHAPILITALMFCYLTNTAITFIINRSWKISAHTMGVAGPLMCLSFLWPKSVLPVYLLIPVVGWARVYLRAHTLMQAIAGGLLGLLLTFIQLKIILQINF